MLCMWKRGPFCSLVLATLEMSKHAKNDNGPLQVEQAEMDI